jgi:hypothetical protein
MDEQSRQLFSQRLAAGTSLAQSCLGGDHHIPQNLRVEIGKGAFAHGKGQHIGGTIDAAIAGVQPAHPGIVDDEDTQVTALTCEGREQSQQRLSERSSVDRDNLLLIPTTDGHSCFACGVSPLPIRPQGIQHGGGRWQ